VRIISDVHRYCCVNFAIGMLSTSKLCLRSGEQQVERSSKVSKNTSQRVGRDVQILRHLQHRLAVDLGDWVAAGASALTGISPVEDMRMTSPEVFDEYLASIGVVRTWRYFTGADDLPYTGQWQDPLQGARARKKTPAIAGAFHQEIVTESGDRRLTLAAGKGRAPGPEPASGREPGRHGLVDGPALATIEETLNALS